MRSVRASNEQLGTQGIFCVQVFRAHRVTQIIFLVYKTADSTYNLIANKTYFWAIFKLVGILTICERELKWS